jgi:hypothetical protein
MRLFHIFKNKGLFWFRLWNLYGFCIEKKDFGRVKFSIRNGYKKPFELFGYYFTYLKP